MASCGNSRPEASGSAAAVSPGVAQETPGTPGGAVCHAVSQNTSIRTVNSRARKLAEVREDLLRARAQCYKARLRGGTADRQEDLKREVGALVKKRKGLEVGLPPGQVRYKPHASSVRGSPRHVCRDSKVVGVDCPDFDIHVITLVGTDESRRRLAKTGMQDFSTNISPGVLPGDVSQFVNDHWAHLAKSIGGRTTCLQGAFSAHWELWKQVAGAGSPATLILEDDVCMLRKFPCRAADYPSDGVAVLGGVFHGARTWKEVNKDALEGGVHVDFLSMLQEGWNPIPGSGSSSSSSTGAPGIVAGAPRMKWTMCVAYFLPRGIAAMLVAKVAATSSRTLRSPDIWLSPHCTHCMWPPPFGDQGARSHTRNQHAAIF
jgi:hypothetical protein